MRTQAEVVQILYAALPPLSPPTHLDLHDADSVRFAWRGLHYRVSLTTLGVEQVLGHMLHSTDVARLLGRLLEVAEHARLHVPA